MGKGKQITFDPKKPKKVTVFLTTAFPAWQQKYIDLVGEVSGPSDQVPEDRRQGAQRPHRKDGRDEEGHALRSKPQEASS